MHLKMVVGGLPFAMTVAQLRELFAPHGVVKSIQVIMDKVTGRSRGFGFVEMSREERSRQRLQLGMMRCMRGGLARE